MKRKPALKAKPLFPNTEPSEPQDVGSLGDFDISGLERKPNTRITWDHTSPVALTPEPDRPLSEVEQAVEIWDRFLPPPEDKFTDPNLAMPLATLYLLKQVVQQLDRIARLLES